MEATAADYEGYALSAIQRGEENRNEAEMDYLKAQAYATLALAAAIEESGRRDKG